MDLGAVINVNYFSTKLCIVTLNIFNILLFNFLLFNFQNLFACIYQTLCYKQDVIQNQFFKQIRDFFIFLEAPTGRTEQCSKLHPACGTQFAHSWSRVKVKTMRWLTNFYDFRFKWTATAAIGIHPTRTWLSQLVNFKNATWTWGHFRRTICNKILF